jgi:hypothetical protein
MNIKQTRQRKWLFLPLSLLFMVACEKVVFEPIVIPNDDLSFAVDIQPIFNANCKSCHPPTKGLDLTGPNAYDALVPVYVAASDSTNPEGSRLYRKLVGSSHMLRTSDVEKQKIIKWISQGVPNN